VPQVLSHYETLHLYTPPQSLYEEIVSLLNAPFQIGKKTPPALP